MTFTNAVVTLLLVMDPLGNVPIFIGLLKTYDAARRRKIILRESIIAFLILVFFLLLGKEILQAMGITQSALGISGGIILFLIALKMMFPPEALKPKTELITHEPFIVPLAVPLIAGPSSLAIVMLLANHHPERLGLWISALAVSSVICTIVLVFSSQLAHFLGQRFLIAIERLMGMLLATLAIQMLLTGVQAYFSPLH